MTEEWHLGGERSWEKGGGGEGGGGALQCMATVKHGHFLEPHLVAPC